MSGEVIGWALGPGKTEDAFDFVTDQGEDLKVGEFVHYETDNSKILCRVSERERLISSDSDVTETFGAQIPDDTLSVLNTNRGHRVTATVLGVYDEQMEGFRNLRSPPSMAQEIYLTQNEFLSHVLTPPKDRGILQVGELLNREENAVGIYTDMDEIATKHLGVLASTGAGKSYTVGVLLEEMVKPGNRGTSVVFDIHGEYYTLAEDEEYKDRFNYIGDPKIKISNLDIEDFEVAFPEEMTNVQRERLREILGDLDLQNETPSESIDNRWRDKVRVNYSLDDIVDRMSQGNNVDDALAWRLGSMKDFACLDVDAETQIEDLCEPGKCNVMEFPTGADELERNLIVWYFTKRILDARKVSVRLNRADEKYERPRGIKPIDVPVMVFIEEAHNFAPNYRELRTRNLLQEISREGRKFGVGLGIITQRPSRLDEDVLSQCNSTIIMKVRNGVDQQAIAETVEAAGEDLLRDLPGLTTGQAILAGDFVNTPVLTKIRKRETEHGGRTPEVAKESIIAYKKKQKEKEQEEKKKKTAAEKKKAQGQKKKSASKSRKQSRNKQGRNKQGRNQKGRNQKGRNND